MPSQAAGATLYVSPASGSFVADSTFDVSVLVNTGGDSVNAVAVDLIFPPDVLQVVKPVPDSSFIAIWIAQPSFSNTEGKIHLEGGAPNPGLTSTAGNIMTITFRAKKSGQAKIKIAETSKVLANDGKGTNILSGKNDATLTVNAKPPAGPTISSSTHPDQNSWYSNSNAQFSWESQGSVSNISWVYDENPTTEPDTKSEELANTLNGKAGSDGLWYLHLRVEQGGAWGGTSHYLTQIDTTAPAKFMPLIEPNRLTFQQRPVVTFSTTDATSGLDHYEVKVEGFNVKDTSSGFFTEQASPYILPTLMLGKHQVAVRAYDRAGNISEGLAALEIVGLSTSSPSAVQTGYIALALLILITLTFLVLHRLRVHHSKGIKTIKPTSVLQPVSADLPGQSYKVPTNFNPISPPLPTSAPGPPVPPILPPNAEPTKEEPYGLE